MKARNFQHFHQQPKHAQQPRMLSKYQNRFGSYIVAGQVYNLCTKGTDRKISGNPFVLSTILTKNLVKNVVKKRIFY